MIQISPAPGPVCYSDRMKRVAIVLAAGLVCACSQVPPSTTGSTPSVGATPSAAASTVPHDQAWLAVFQPLPEAETLSPEMVELGRMLYYDPRLSKSGTISCNSCHALDRYGVDGEPTSPGFAGERGGRNSPTVYNAALHAAQFWDGRARDVEEQAAGPVTNPVEMGMADEKAVTTALKSIPEYRRRFAQLFPEDKDPLTLANTAHAIGAFERGLLTPSRLDAYLKGDKTALSAEELAGAKTFVEVGCASCHLGPTLGGRSFQKLGLKQPYPDEDPGRMAVTGKESDRARFKVPALRNITETGPYFHNGQVKTLEEAVSLMGVHQLGKTLTPEEIASIVTFLGALKGEIPADYIAPPKLPPAESAKPEP